jgi:2-(1,2-epoxy-1,2-dihydrophenyl)acetyl-CoA isomerase
MPVVELTVDGGLARLVLNRPDAANAMDPELAAALREAAIELETRPEVRAVLLTGNGRVFCGGGDLAAMAEAGGARPALVAGITIDLHAALARFARLPAPIVAGVRGAAGGAGLSLVAACDLVVAGEGARFTLGYTKVGLAPDGSSSWYLARVVGLRRAMDLALTNRVLSASEAETWGLVNRVVPDDEVEGVAEDLARSLAQGPVPAQGLAKQLLIAGSDAALEAAMERESGAIARAAASPHADEGIRAFLDKRPPDFS